jgi:hypothetical protein
MRVSRMELAAMSHEERMAALAKLAHPAKAARAPKPSPFTFVINLFNSVFSRPVRRVSR